MSELFLLLSFTGFFLFWNWFRKDVHPSFYPALTVSVISVLTCLGGIAGILRWTAKVLFFFGLFSLAFFGVLHFRKGFQRIRVKENKAFFLMLGTFLFFCVCMMHLLRHRFVYQYDDFSHWALVAKIMLNEGRLPVSSDGLLFPSYPLGSASFIFFCGYMLGSGATACFLSQSIMLISFLIALQSAADRQKKGDLLTTCSIPLFLFYNTSLNSLTVDNILGAAILSAMLLFFRQGRKAGQNLPEFAVILACCVLIKNSGAFLALGMAVLLMIQHCRADKKNRYVILFLLFPLLVFLAWRIHIKTSFDSFGKHYMSLSVYYGTLRGRLGEIGQILQLILSLMINPVRNHALLLIPAFAIAYMGSSWKKRKKQKQIILVCSIFFVLYEAGILVMYVCSMGVGELFAQNGADFPRYNGTMVCVLSGMLIYIICDSFCGEEHSMRAPQILSFLASLVLTIFCMSLNMKPLQGLERNRLENPEAWNFFRQTEGKTFSPGQQVAVLCSQPTVSEYEMYMAFYYLYPSRQIRFYSMNENIPEDEGVTIIDLKR